jgi:23S rRNA (adenine2503-C2)-methyltransferase
VILERDAASCKPASPKPRIMQSPAESNAESRATQTAALAGSAAGPERANLLDFPRPELEAYVTELGGKPFRARQLLNWVYKRGEGRIACMTDLAKDFRARLAERAEVRPPRVVEVQQSQDGTCKWKLEADAAQAFEMVYIPEDDRGTLCISSQVGCALDCSFCSTAQQGFNRNLTTGEIIGQVWLANRELAAAGCEAPSADSAAPISRLDGGRPATERAVTNVVFMGMGEPLANFRNVVAACRILLDDYGFDLSRRRVTLSTSGLVPQIYRLAEEVNVALAVSLHAPDDELRSELVPINRKHPIAELLEACWHYLDERNGRSVTFEYVMLDGINDSPAQARRLARLLAGRPAKVNLIPFNPFPGTRYRRSPPERIVRFRDELIQRGLIATIRRTRGEDIDAACGQLAGRVIDRTTVRLGGRKMSLIVER